MEETSSSNVQYCMLCKLQLTRLLMIKFYASKLLKSDTLKMGCKGTFGMYLVCTSQFLKYWKNSEFFSIDRPYTFFRHISVGIPCMFLLKGGRANK